MRHQSSPPIIDVEASGFGVSSYPIEVGVVLNDGRKFCTLITPAPDWTYWDEEAEETHHVSRDMLEAHGKPIDEVAKQLNDLLTEKTLYSDGWGVDKPWLIKLFHAAAQSMTFYVSPLELLLSEEQMEIWHETKDAVIRDTNLTRHRASSDAWVIQETFRQTFHKVNGHRYQSE